MPIRLRARRLPYRSWKRVAADVSRLTLLADLRRRYQRLVAGGPCLEDDAWHKPLASRAAEEGLAVVARKLGIEVAQLGERRGNCYRRAGLAGRCSGMVD